MAYKFQDKEFEALLGALALRYREPIYASIRELVMSYFHEYLTQVMHFPVINAKQIRNLRRADPIEIETGEITEWKRKG